MSDVMSPLVSVEVADDVGWLTLNRPDAMNAISVGLAQALDAALANLADRSSVIVIRGSGGNFCVGGDFAEVVRLSAQGDDALAELFESFGAACRRIGEIDVPVIAAVEGFATAGGFELMLASDIVVISDNAKVADHHANFAQIPGGGSTQRLARIVGRQRALALILTGGRLTPQECVDWGIAHQVVPAEDFEAAVTCLSRALAEKSPSASAKIKRLVRDGLEGPLEEGLANERRLVVDHIRRDAAANAAAAAFINRSSS